MAAEAKEVEELEKRAYTVFKSEREEDISAIILAAIVAVLVIVTT